MRPRLVWLVAALSVCSIVGCSDEAPYASAGPTYHTDVERILQRSCTGCHAPGRIAPFDLTTYASAREVASLIAVETRAKRMPPWGADETDDCTPRLPIRDDPRLTDEEIALLDSWSKAGAPEGDPRQAPPKIDPASTGLARVDLELEPKQPFVASGDEDQFECFVLNPKLGETKYVSAFDIVPANPKVVHHAVVSVDASGQSALLGGAEGRFECFSFPPGPIVAVWAPGGVPFELASNVGVAVPAGARMIMQVHYHPAGADAEPDATKLQMRFTDADPEYLMVLGGGGCIGPELCAPKPNGDGLQPGPDDGAGTEFRIPAGVAGHTESFRQTQAPACQGICPAPDVHVYGAFAHMHYLGTEEAISLEHEAPPGTTPDRECLLHVPRWDFSWQRMYVYDAPIEELPQLRAGDAFDVRCTYDNTTANPGVVRLMKETHASAPQDVVLGEQSTDEMCGFAIPLVVKRQ